MKNTFFIYIKLLKTNPETGAAFEAPCEIPTTVIVDLHSFIHDFQRVESDNSEAYKGAIVEILSGIQKTFDCPLGWFIGMESVDEFFAMDNPFYKPESRFSEEFFYSPEHEKTAIDVEFMYAWAVEQLQKRYAVN